MLWLENASSLHAVITAKYCYFCEILLWPSKKPWFGNGAVYVNVVCQKEINYFLYPLSSM